MKLLHHLSFTILLAAFLVSCNSPDKSIHIKASYDEYVFAVQLVNDSALVDKYLDYHQNIWPEVEAGFRQAGYEQIRLYRFETFVAMIVRVPSGADLGEMGQVSNDSHARAAEWNRLMEDFQKGLPGAREGQTWVVLDKFYEFDRTMTTLEDEF
jgi:L-rhamnose mutarotase